MSGLYLCLSGKWAFSNSSVWQNYSLSCYQFPSPTAILSSAAAAAAASLQSCPTLWDPMDCNPPGSSVHGILQARELEWLPFPSPGDLPNSGVEPRSPVLRILYHLSQQGQVNWTSNVNNYCYNRWQNYKELFHFLWATFNITFILFLC